MSIKFNLCYICYKNNFRNNKGTFTTNICFMYFSPYTLRGTVPVGNKMLQEALSEDAL